MEHPDESILLAYTREQALDESWPGIEHHLDTCEQCSQRSLEYRQLSTELSETLAHFQRQQSYPPLSERIFERIKQTGSASGQRERERRERSLAGRRSFRTAVMPGAALLLVLLFASLVLTARADWSYLGHLIVLSGQNGIRELSATAVKSQTPQSVDRQLGSNSATGTLTPDRGPTIKMCTKSADSNQSRLRLCGANFTPGEKVQIVIHEAGGGSRTLHPVLVDAQGHFQDTWVVASCKDVPTSIDVQGETNTTEASLDLRGNHHLGSVLFETGC